MCQPAPQSPSIHAPAPLNFFNEAIGATPLLRCSRLERSIFDGLAPGVRVWAKLEQYNAGGSAKDRTAYALVEEALDQGVIDPRKPVTLVESSSGNLGMALARQAMLRGWEFRCVVDQRTNAATVASMRALGAKVELVKEPDPDTGDWLAARRKKVAELLEQLPGSINLDQYSNQAAFRAHARTMAEIEAQVGRAPDWLFVAMSTTGTIGGCLRHIEASAAATRAVGVDAEGSVLFGGVRANRLLPGYGAGVVPELSAHVHPFAVSRIVDIDAVVAARVLARTEGLIPGASGGAVLAAAMRYARQFQQDQDVVLLLHDAGSNYMDTIYNDAWVQEHLHTSPAEVEARIQEALA